MVWSTRLLLLTQQLISFCYIVFVQAAAGGYSTILRELLLSGADMDESRLETAAVSRSVFQSCRVQCVPTFVCCRCCGCLVLIIGM